LVDKDMLKEYYSKLLRLRWRNNSAYCKKAFQEKTGEFNGTSVQGMAVSCYGGKGGF